MCDSTVTLAATEWFVPVAACTASLYSSSHAIRLTEKQGSGKCSACAQAVVHDTTARCHAGTTTLAATIASDSATATVHQHSSIRQTIAHIIQLLLPRTPVCTLLHRLCVSGLRRQTAVCEQRNSPASHFDSIWSHIHRDLHYCYRHYSYIAHTFTRTRSQHDTSTQTSNIGLYHHCSLRCSLRIPAAVHRQPQ